MKLSISEGALSLQMHFFTTYSKSHPGHLCCRAARGERKEQSSPRGAGGDQSFSHIEARNWTLSKQADPLHRKLQQEVRLGTLHQEDQEKLLVANKHSLEVRANRETNEFFQSGVRGDQSPSAKNCSIKERCFAYEKTKQNCLLCLLPCTFQNFSEHLAGRNGFGI